MMDEKGGFLLREAVSSGKTELLKEILDRKTIPVDAKSFDGETAIFGALNNEETARLLIVHGASVNSVDVHGRSLLYRATVEGTEEVGIMLLEAGADPSIADMHGENVLLRAIWTRKMRMVDMILSRAPACATQSDKAGNTALHVAAHIGCVDTARKLLRASAQVNQKNKVSETPLCVAIVRQRLDMVAFLIRNGANVNDFDSLGDSLLHVAVRMKISSLVQILLDAGASTTTRNALDLLPIDLCRTKRHSRVLGLLERNPPSVRVRVRDDVSERNKKRRRRQFVSIDARIIEMI